MANVFQSFLSEDEYITITLWWIMRNRKKQPKSKNTVILKAARSLLFPTKLMIIYPITQKYLHWKRETWRWVMGAWLKKGSSMRNSSCFFTFPSRILLDILSSWFAVIFLIGCFTWGVTFLLGHLDWELQMAALMGLSKYYFVGCFNHIFKWCLTIFLSVYLSVCSIVYL